MSSIGASGETDACWNRKSAQDLGRGICSAGITNRKNVAKRPKNPKVLVSKSLHEGFATHFFVDRLWFKLETKTAWGNYADIYITRPKTGLPVLVLVTATVAQQQGTPPKHPKTLRRFGFTYNVLRNTH